MTPETHWKHARTLDQFVYNEHGIYNEHTVFLIIFHFWVKNTILSKIFSNKLELRQCVFIRYQGDRLSKYLNSEIHPRIWQIGKSWKTTQKTNKSHHFTHLAQEPGKRLKKLKAVLVDEKHEGEAFSRRYFTFVWRKRTKNQKLSKKSLFGLFLRMYFAKRPANFLVRLDMRCYLIIYEGSRL